MDCVSCPGAVCLPEAARKCRRNGHNKFRKSSLVVALMNFDDKHIRILDDLALLFSSNKADVVCSPDRSSNVADIQALPRKENNVKF